MGSETRQRGRLGSLKISVITAVYNRADTIQDALDSVAMQDYAQIEHVVVDGASHDGTVEILQRNSDQIDALISETDNGIYDALNKGIRLATGDVIGFLHADDVFASTKVLSRIAAEFAAPTVDATYGDLVYVSNDDKRSVIRHWKAGHFSQGRLAWGWMPPHPTLYVRRDVYERLGTFDNDFGIAADYDCILRLLGRGKVSPAYIPDVLVKMRIGGASNGSLRKILQKSREDYQALRRNEIGGVGALAWKNLSKLRQYFAHSG